MVCVSAIISYLSEKGYIIEYYGEDDIQINGFCSIREIKNHSITWVKNEAIFASISQDSKRLFKGIMVTPVFYEDNTSFGQIVTSSPKAVFFEIVDYFFKEKNKAIISKLAVVETKSMGNNVSIGNYSYIGPDVELGNNVVIGNNVSIECPCKIGDNTKIASGVVIGTDGFGYYRDFADIHRQVPHFGGVVIGNNVDIGANTCIDRGTIEDTIIADNVKIDNLCHIAHNVKIGENTLIIAQSLIGGSSSIGDDCYLAPGVIVRNQVSVGNRSMVGMGAVVTKNVNSGELVAGVPARFVRDNKEKL